MHEAVTAMMDRYRCRTTDDYTNALREIMQEVALLGLWRARFFEHAAFYGGTALRVLHQLDRYSEDMDFSLLRPDAGFQLGAYGGAIERELQAYGFDVSLKTRPARADKPIHSAFLKANTYESILTITTAEDIAEAIPRGKILKIKLEVDTQPPGRFDTESRFLLQPIPFVVRSYTLPSLFAGKMHAALCRRWGTRVKGRDWYDLVWYVARRVPLDLDHLRERMIQSGDLEAGSELTPRSFRQILSETIETLDVDSARTDAAPFVRDPGALKIWSREFFRDVAGRIGFAESRGDGG